jgi:DNA-binding transcriptional LysR family regulator
MDSPLEGQPAPVEMTESHAASLPAPHAQAYVDPRHYRTFLAVVEQGGKLTAAARELGMSQPGVTHQINELERRLGVPLLDRARGRAARLTRAGRVFERYARSMVGLQAAMQSDLEQMSRGIGGHLRVGASPGPGEHWLPPLLCAFREEYPDLHIELHVADARSIVEQVFEGELELGCVGGRWTRAGLRFEPVWRDEFVLVASPAHPLTQRGQLRMGDLAGIPFIAQEPGTGLRTTFEQELGDRGLTLGYFDVLAELGNQESVKSAVAAGWGVGCVWKHSIAAELALGTLDVLDIEGFHPDSDYYLVRRASRRLSRRSQALRDFLLLTRAQQAESLRQDGGDDESGE